MGEDGHFARELTKIRKHANQVTYKTPDGKRIIGYVNVMKHFRRTGNTSDSIKYYSRIQLRVENALRQAINRVHPRLTDAAEIRLEGNLQTKNEKAALRQDSNIVNQLLELN